jgi:hypothetical protein
MPKKGARVVPEGFVKTSFEITKGAKFALEDLKTALRRKDGYAGISEAAVVETLILAAKKVAVDTKLLDAVLKRRRKLQDDPKKAG